MPQFQDWNEDSLLSQNGYAADGSISEARRHIILSRIVANHDLATLKFVIEHFRWLIEDRGSRMPKAKRIWQEDLVYFCRLINAKS